MKPVYLASSSPRRQQLLKQVGLQFSVIEPAVDESGQGEADPGEYTQRLAGAKANHVRQIITTRGMPWRTIIAGDTAVVCNQTIFGKPKNKDHATSMLAQLSGSTHQVYSAVCILRATEFETITQVSDVTFRRLTDRDIDAYWKSGEPKDKAGAYGIQGIGAKFIKNLSGSYSGVMGLPLYELMNSLEKNGYE